MKRSGSKSDMVKNFLDTYLRRNEYSSLMDVDVAKLIESGDMRSVYFNVQDLVDVVQNTCDFKGKIICYKFPALLCFVRAINY